MMSARADLLIFDFRGSAMRFISLCVWCAIGTAALGMQGLAVAQGRSEQSSGPVNTPSGTFPDCTAAVKFRNGPLINSLDAEFVRYDRGVQERVAKTVRELRGHHADLNKAYQAADQQRTQETIDAAAKSLFYEALGKLAGRVSKSKQFVRLSKREKGIIKHLGKRAAVGKAKLAGQAFTGEHSIEPFIKDHLKLAIEVAAPNLQQRAAIKLGGKQLAKFLGGPVGTVVVLAGEAGIEAASTYMSESLDMDAISAEREVLRKGIEKMIKESPEERLKRVRLTRQIIDQECSGKRKGDDELSNIERLIEGAGRGRNSGGPTGSLQDELDRARQGYASSAERHRDATLRAQRRAMQSALRGMAATFSARGGSSSGGCSENQVGRAPRHCCQLVQQQIAEYRRASNASVGNNTSQGRQYRATMQQGIKHNQAWYRQHC